MADTAAIGCDEDTEHLAGLEFSNEGDVGGVGTPFKRFNPLYKAAIGSVATFIGYVIKRIVHRSVFNKITRHQLFSC